MRGTGAGGQHRNKTDSGIRLTHHPTGIVVTATEHRSQHVNRTTAWERLRAAIDEHHHRHTTSTAAAARVAQFGGRREWVWVAWRDSVTAPDGTSVSYRRALTGRFGSTGLTGIDGKTDKAR